ncbi:MAG: NUDIX hydrolase, partial [Parachlamydia sp.]|nr:NUDIX hydrolase [Parachlamydia sp.]
MEADTVYHGDRFDVVSLPIGNNKRRDVILHPGAVVILPILDHEHILLIRNQRFAVGKELWELPAGTLEKGEAPLETAKRELIEETGYEAAEMEPLTQFYTSPGFC